MYIKQQTQGHSGFLMLSFRLCDYSHVCLHVHFFEVFNVSSQCYLVNSYGDGPMTPHQNVSKKQRKNKKKTK